MKRRLLVKDDVKETKVDDYLNFAILMNTRKLVEERRRDEDHDTEKVAKIRRANQGNLTVKPLKLPTKTIPWEEALDIYEHNQNVYLQQLDSPKMVQALKDLEAWFVKLAEPKPEDEADEIDAWKQREKQRKEGISAYCDDEVRKILSKKSRA